MKLKQSHNDFKVEEVSDLTISKEPKKYKLYLLEKRGMETFYLLSYLAKENNIPVTEFGIAGLKDKHAITRQYMTIPEGRELKTLHERGFDLELLGYTDERLEIGSLIGNRFTITVRNVKKGEIDGIYFKAREVEKSGVPNYFDSQRFGSVINNNFVVKYAVRGDYEKAVKTYMTQFTKSEPSRVKNEKRELLKSWVDIVDGLPNGEKIRPKTTSLSNILEEYRKTKDWTAAYRRIPTNVRKMALSAYQSHIWNECVKLMLKKILFHEQMYTIKYAVGELVFYKTLKETQKKELPETLNLVGPKMDFSGMEPAGASGMEEWAIKRVLVKEGVRLEQFDIQKETGDYFGVRARPVIIVPKDFKISEPEVDELNDNGKKNTFKITLSFELPKGSYATMVTKRIFNR